MQVKRALTVRAVAVLLTAGLGLAHSSQAFAGAGPFGVGMALVGHAGPVSSIAFSPNGRTLAAATENGTVQLWDIRRDRLAGTLTGLVHIVDSVAFSPNGRTVAAGSRGGAVRLWDAPRRRELGAALRAHAGSVYSVTFSPNGRILAAASANGTVQLWDVNSHRLRGQLNNHAGAIASLAFSPNGRRLATGDIRGTVVFWDVHTDASSEFHCGPIILSTALPTVPTAGRSRLGNGDQGTVGLWDVQSQHLDRSLRTGNSGPVNSVAFCSPHTDSRHG